MADLPAIMDPLLDYLSSRLNPHLYAIVVTVFEQSYALISSLVSLAGTLLSAGPSSWDAQTIIPPLITLLAAYLALVSFYRTTGWMIRMMFGFVKWGFILTTLGGMAGYILANANEGGGNGLGALGSGLVSTLGSMFLEMLNGQGANTNSKKTSRSSSRSSTAHQNQKSKPKSKQTRPKVHEPWDRHRQWQYSEDATAERQGADVQKVIGDILGNAGKFMKESGWYDVAKGTVEKLVQGLGGESEENEKASDSADRNTKKTRSR